MNGACTDVYILVPSIEQSRKVAQSAKGGHVLSQISIVKYTVQVGRRAYLSCIQFAPVQYGYLPSSEIIPVKDIADGSSFGKNLAVYISTIRSLLLCNIFVRLGNWKHNIYLYKYIMTQPRRPN